jgi:hypothetical protein
MDSSQILEPLQGALASQPADSLGPNGADPRQIFQAAGIGSIQFEG